MENNNSNNKIKLVILIDELRGLCAGTETQLKLIIDRLDENKYEIYLICLRETAWLSKNYSLLKCHVKSFQLKSIFRIDFFHYFFVLILYIKRISPHIMITFFKDSNLYGPIAAKIAGVSTIITTRRDYGLWIDRKSKYLLALSNKLSTRVIANSNKVKQLVCEKEIVDCGKVDVIYNGLKFENTRLARFNKNEFKKRIGIPLEDKIVGIVANLRPMKRHTTFLKAAKLILHMNRNTSFLIIGGGNLKKQLKKQAKYLNIERKVFFVGSQNDVAPFFKILDLGINCSANEGLSNAIMEYMYYMVPCIVSSAGGNSELIKHGTRGYTFELDNHKELAKYVIDLLQNKELMEKFKVNSYSWITENLTIEKMIDKYDYYFTQSISKHGLLSN